MAPHGTEEARVEQSSTLRLYKSLIGAVDKVTFWAVVVSMGLMTAIVSVQVICRYFFSTSIDSADELSRLFFVWSVFLAIPYGIRQGIHVGIDLIVRAMPTNIQHVLFRGCAAASAGLMCLVFMASLTATADKWPELMPTLPVTAAVFYMPVLFCAGHSFLHLVALAWGGPETWAGDIREEGAEA